MRRSKSNGTSKSKPEEASLLSQLSEPLRDFVSDFKTHGKSVMEQVRLENPIKYLELSAKLAQLVATLKPEPHAYSECETMEDIAVALLKSCGVAEESMTPDVIAAADEANKTFIARVEEIARAAGGEED